jgi:hypothetical protein
MLGDSSASTSHSQVDPPSESSEESVSKRSLLDQLDIISAEEVVQTGSRPRTLFSRVTLHLARSHPALQAWLTKAVLYIRGPRPKVGLPCASPKSPPRLVSCHIVPTPLLNIDIHIAGSHVVVPLESTLIKSTRFLTSPRLFIFLVIAYITGFALFARAQSFLTPPESYLGCTSTYWLANNQCGENGEDCGPFNDTPFEFRCPAQCSNVILQNPRTVGDEQIAFKPLIVGGGDENRTYRGDSFICAAAVQAYVLFIVGYRLLLNFSSPEVSFRMIKVVVGLFDLEETIRTSFHSLLTDLHQSDSQQFSPSPFVYRASLP